jgi:hypothetical protein
VEVHAAADKYRQHCAERAQEHAPLRIGEVQVGQVQAVRELAQHGGEAAPHGSDGRPVKVVHQALGDDRQPAVVFKRGDQRRQ